MKIHTFGLLIKRTSTGGIKVLSNGLSVVYHVHQKIILPASNSLGKQVTR